MKKTALYQHLIELAGKLEIRISEQNLRATGVGAKSGLCRVKDEYVLILEKKLTLSEKIEILSDSLKSRPLDDIYIAPAVRDYLNQK